MKTKFAIVASVCLAIAAICGCGAKNEEVEKTSSTIISMTEVGRYKGWWLGAIVTVKHDDHWFLLWNSTNKGTLLHHPSCPKCTP